MIPVLAAMTAVLAGIGVLQALTASGLVFGFSLRRTEAPALRPAVTVLKPLHGDEPLLEDALTTLFRQDYPNWQIVFGVQSGTDPAMAVVRRLQTRFPEVNTTLVVDPTLHGVNRKVGNLINMFPKAQHDILVIADSDVHVQPDYLDRLVAALQQPGIGLVTTLYAGLPVAESGRLIALPARLGATQITHGFLPGAVLSRAVGRQDCLGATMGLRRRDLQRIGGFPALVDHLVDDNVLGQRIAALGLGVALAKTIPLTTVPETRIGALFRHELRWARTIRVIAPLGFAASFLQYPLAWGLLSILASAGAVWSVGLFFAAWVLRAAAAMGVDRALARVWQSSRRNNREAALAFSCPVWLLPLRDVLSVTVMLASYGGREVNWRGYGLKADTPPALTDAPRPLARLREAIRDDEDPFPAPALVRRLRRWCGCPLPGEAGNQVVLVSHLVGPAGGPGAREQID